VERKQYDIEKENDWARNVKGTDVFIEDSESGRKGYYCIGCSKEMEAVIQKKNPNRKSYFRHVPVDIEKGEKPCTFSNRKYRETLAADILQRLKLIKVPAVYKFSSDNKKAPPNILQPSKFINAHKVSSQVWFYEDDNGNVLHGKNPVDERYLLMRPDVVFFDIKGKAILFIELVITHKIDDEKRIKLRRLGIDTISVIVPRSAEQEIEDNFKTTQRTKWEYNGIEANTNYVPISSGTSAGILEPDEEQRRIFEEGYACRKSRLSNTLRTIKRCLGAKPYRRAEREFEQQISRIEKATKRTLEELGRLEETARKEVDLRFAARRTAIEVAVENFEQSENQFESEEADLEGRYFAKDQEIRENHDQILRDIARGGENEFEREQAEEEIEKERKFVESRVKETRTARKRISEKREGLPDQFAKFKEQESANFEVEKGRIERKASVLQFELDNFEETIIRRKKQLEDEFEIIREQSIKRINQEDTTEGDELSKGIAQLSEIRRILGDFGERQSTYQGYKKALKLARSGTWKAQ
jgi:hypothetical protein